MISEAGNKCSKGLGLARRFHDPVRTCLKTTRAKVFTLQECVPPPSPLPLRLGDGVFMGQPSMINCDGPASLPDVTKEAPLTLSPAALDTLTGVLR